MIYALDYYIKKISNDIILLIIGKIDTEYKIINLAERLGINKNIVFLPPIDFDKIDILLNTLKKEKAIFISPSKGETFGLSAAEVLAYDCPLILSNIESHSNLVSAMNPFLYELGDIKSLAKKIKFIFENYASSTKKLKSLKNKFSANNFKKEWEKSFPDKYN